MSKQASVIHSTFSIERTFPQPPAHVFFAHANEAMKRRWLAEGKGWTVNKFTLDFSVGGSEISRFRYLDGPEITYDEIRLVVGRLRREDSLKKADIPA